VIGALAMRRVRLAHILLCAFVFVSRVVLAESDDTDAESPVRKAHAHTLEQLLLARDSASPDVRDAVIALAREASLVPSFEELLARPEYIVEVDRDEDLVAREALYALASVSRVGVVDIPGIISAHGDDDDGSLAKVLSGGGPLWHVVALERAARMGDEWARVALGWRWWKGVDGYAVDEDKALELFREVAKIGLERGPTSYEIDSASGGEWLRDKERDASWQAESVLNKADGQLQMEIDAANRGDDAANALLGYRALVGDRGLARDERAAFRHFEQAAQGADVPEAHYNLGFLHMQGVGTEKNYTRAREEFIKAIQTGAIAPAFNGMGVLNFQGLGGEQNYTKAMYYFEEAANRQDPDGYFNLAQMYAVGYEGVVDANVTRSLELMTKANELGHWRAPYELGLVYSSGVAIERNVTKSVDLFHTFIEERFDWSKDEDDAIEEVILNRNPWGALVRYAQVASLGSESAANNVAWLLRRTNAYVGEDKFELAARALRDIVHCHGSPEASVDLAQALASGKAQPDDSDFMHPYEYVLAHASAQDAAAANRLAKAAFSEHPYPEALVNLGWAHLFGAGVQANATRSYELFARAADASSSVYEATPCVAASVIAKAWMTLAKTSKALGFGAFGLPDAVFAAATSASTSTSTSTMSLIRVLRMAEVMERYLLIALTFTLGAVLIARLVLPLVDGFNE